MKVLIVKPNGKEKQYGVTKSISAIEPPIWAALYANSFNNVEILDCEALNLNLDETVGEILKRNVDSIEIFSTGSHPSAHIQQAEISNAIRNRILDINIKKYVKIHTSLSFNPTVYEVPRWDLLDMTKYRPHNWHTWGISNKDNYGVTYSSIGCPFSCKFCTVKNFYGTKYKIRNANCVINDIKLLYSKYNITNIKMMDELFAINDKRTYQICDELKYTIGDKLNIWAYARIDTVNDSLLRQLRAAGVRWLAYGIESGNEDIRKNMNKGTFSNSKIEQIIKMTKDNGINVLGNYMFGFWEDNTDTMKETLDLAIKLNCEYSNFYCTVAYPDSEFIDICNERGIKIPENYDKYSQMSYNFHPLPTKNLTAKEVLSFRDKAFNEYFTNPSYIYYMNNKFGKNVISSIKEMTELSIRRKLLE